MITWMPCPTYKETASVLSDRDLKLQRTHVKKLLDVFTSGNAYVLSKKKTNTVKAWRGHLPSLVQYGVEIAFECKRRFKTQRSGAQSIRKHIKGLRNLDLSPPGWVRDPFVRHHHRSLLLKRDFGHYITQFITGPPDMPFRPNMYDTETCVACGGSGKSSKDQTCIPCDGGGKRKHVEQTPWHRCQLIKEAHDFGARIDQVSPRGIIVESPNKTIRMDLYRGFHFRGIDCLGMTGLRLYVKLQNVDGRSCCDDAVEKVFSDGG